MSKAYFLIPILLFIIFSMITLYQISNIKDLISKWKSYSHNVHKIDLTCNKYKLELLKIENKKKILLKKQMEIKTYFRMLGNNYTQNNFRNAVDSQSQRFGLLIKEFIFSKNNVKISTPGLRKDMFKMQLRGNYLDFIRFIYVIAEKFNNFDLRSVSISRNTVYEEKVLVTLKGTLYKYVQ